MVKSCCVKSCRAEWSPGSSVSFFSMPMRNEPLFNKWKEAIPTTKSKIGKYSTICSKHFLPNEVKRVGAKTILKKNAVPTIFDDEQLQLKTLSSDTFQSTVDSNDSIMDFSQGTDDSWKFSVSEETLQNTTTEDVESNIQDQQVIEPLNKKDKSVQTSPHRVGPSEREIQLQQKIKVLQEKLRRREKTIASTKDLVNHLKDNGRVPIIWKKFS